MFAVAGTVTILLIVNKVPGIAYYEIIPGDTAGVIEIKEIEYYITRHLFYEYLIYYSFPEMNYDIL